MGLDVLRRVRWGNVSLTLALLALIVWGIAGPLTATSPAPRLPPDRTFPLLPSSQPPKIVETPRAPAVRARRPTPKPKRPARKHRPAHKSRARPVGRSHRAKAPTPQPPAPKRATRAAPTVPAPSRPVAPRPPASGEFDFEGG
jgi:hypothetical protein